MANGKLQIADRGLWGVMKRVHAFSAVLISLLLAHQTVLADERQEKPFAIDFGLSGSWYNPDTSGQGFVFDVVPVPGFGPHLFVAYWFTHALESGGPETQRWMVAEGKFEFGDDVVELDVYQTTGGSFDGPDEADSGLIGMAKLVFHDCSSATFSYELEFDGNESLSVAGTMPVERLSPDVVCKRVPEVAIEAPETVSPTDSLEIIYSIKNTVLSDTVIITTPESCLSIVWMLNDQQEVVGGGGDGVCATAVTHREIPPGHTLERTYKVHAGGSGSFPKGRHTISVESKVVRINGVPGTLPDVEVDILVE